MSMNRDDIRIACETFAREYDLKFIWTPADTLILKAKIGDEPEYVSCQAAAPILDAPRYMRAVEILHGWWKHTAKSVNALRCGTPEATAERRAEFSMVIDAIAGAIARGGTQADGQAMRAKLEGIAADAEASAQRERDAVRKGER